MAWVMVHGGDVPTAFLPRFAPEEFPIAAPLVPRQPNSSDCALFVLQNMETLLRNRSLIEKLRIDLDGLDLYDPSVAVDKRRELRALVFSLVGHADPAAPSVPEGCVNSSVVTLSPSRRRVVPVPADGGDARAGQHGQHDSANASSTLVHQRPLQQQPNSICVARPTDSAATTRGTMSSSKPILGHGINAPLVESRPSSPPRKRRKFTTPFRKV
ncbi:hypothetical protein KFL_003430080 [Klebsormidium nitens]|uniref:Ubiquitin-like protease family profile domain-containing protein n=1 Tax=Klebsormidium nitens TaxID=105231 RepID=A0A0U9HSX5_KLENI|nr:hypothetical protein KFL_003430080 [Klebsormidium nitens]|eukprot:GAQ87289.1 hypothetical protein KFL_003430080 [Klebsormidium nitens]